MSISRPKQNPATVRAWQTRRRDDNRANYRAWLMDKFCVDCNETDSIVLELDHLGDKRYNVSNLMASTRSWSFILKEIEKCVVRCANCHRRKTAIERGWHKAKTHQNLQSSTQNELREFGKFR